MRTDCSIGLLCVLGGDGGVGGGIPPPSDTLPWLPYPHVYPTRRYALPPPNIPFPRYPSPPDTLYQIYPTPQKGHGTFESITYELTLPSCNFWIHSILKTVLKIFNKMKQNFYCVFRATMSIYMTSNHI